jgi:uncharacterized membrane protein
MLQLPSRARRRRGLLVLVASLLLATAGAGWLGVVVHADWQPPPAMKPYDPMQSW